jgi:arylsulfatase
MKLNTPFLLFVLTSFVSTVSVTFGQDWDAVEIKRPNVIVILVDDMGWSDISSYGGEIPTPEIDKLAENGVRFTQFYNTSRCSTTRASLLTGHYPHQAGMGYLDGFVIEGSKGFQGRIADTSTTLAQILADHGYLTAVTGKWHLGQRGLGGYSPWVAGFQRNLTAQAGGIYFPDQGGDRGERPLYLGPAEIEKDDPVLGDDWYITDLITEWGVKFIDEAVDNGQPFFLYLSHIAPHFPLMAPQETIEKYRKGTYMKGWDVLREERRQRQIEMELISAEWPLPQTKPDTPLWDDLSEAEKDRFDLIQSIYAATIDHIDQSVGYLVNELESRGLMEDTVIFFLSDNGSTAESGPNGRLQGRPAGGPQSNVWLGMNWAHLGNTPFRRFKHFTHEGGIATPLIVHWPDRLMQEGKMYRQTNVGPMIDFPGHLIDLMPTILDITGSSYPEKSSQGSDLYPMEGISLYSMLTAGELIERSKPIFFEHEGNRAVRDGKWKAVSRHLEPWALYDMEKDRTEVNDLSETYPDKLERYKQLYKEWAVRTHVDEWPGGPRHDWGAPINN